MRVAALGAAAAGLAALYSLGALLPFWFLSDPSAGSPFFPPAGLTVSVLVLTNRRSWPLWLSVIAVSELVIDLTHHLSVPLSLGFAIANTGEPLIGALLLLAAMRSHWVALRRPFLFFLVCCVVAAPVFGAVVGTTTAIVFGSGSDWSGVAVRWWLGDALGVIVVATFILSWNRRWPYDATAGPFELTAMVVLATGITVAPALMWHHPMIYAVLPVLMWAALRGGARAVSAAGIGVSLAAGWVTVTGRANDLLAAGDSGQQLLFVQVFLGLTLLAAFTLVAEVAERRRLEDVARRAEADRNTSERFAIEAANAERRRIARETHDIVGHALNVMLLEAGVARRVLPTDPERAYEHLESLESVGRAAFRELDVALAIVDVPQDSGTERGLEGVPELVEAMRSAGVDVELAVDGRARPVPTLVDWSAFRIVQEALTNVAKHAPTAHATVTISYGEDEISVAVVDDGRGAARNGSWREGRGLIGIGERVAVLGGRMHAGRDDAGGFAVRVAIPVSGNH